MTISSPAVSVGTYVGSAAHVVDPENVLSGPADISAIVILFPPVLDPASKLPGALVSNP